MPLPLMEASSLRAVFAAAVLASSAGAAPAAEPPTPGGESPGEAGVLMETDRRFDENRIPWRDDAVRAPQVWPRRRRSAATCWRSRPRVGGRTPRWSAPRCQRFRDTHAAPLPGRPHLRGFEVTAESFVDQLRGRCPLEPGDSFEAFSGRWYGLWDGDPVDHHWHPVERAPVPAAPAARPPEDGGPPELVGLQYAWIGDGFGWNYLVRPEGAAGAVVLGHVSHLNPYVTGEEGAVKSSFPLVGYLDAPGRLIWVTSFGVYFEEILAAADPADVRYAITGFRYEIAGGDLAFVGDGYQAIYGRSPDDRPVYRTFPITRDAD